MRLPIERPQGQPVVAIFREMLLNYNEPFILSHSEALTRYQPYYVGMHRVTGLELPSERTIVLNGGTRLGNVCEAAFKLVGMPVPSFAVRVQRTGVSVIHAYTGVSGAQALPLARQLGVPLVVTCTGYEATATREELAQYRYRGRVYLRRLEALKRNVRLFLAVSEFIRRRLLDQGFPEAKVVVHYVGVDTTFFRADPQVRREPLVLFIGRLIKTKGVAHLIRAMARVSSRVPEAELVVIGKGGLRADLERLASDERVKVHFLGSQTRAEVHAWMNRASVLSTPSVPSTDGTVEALPAVCAEAQAMGLPVCGFASGGIAEGVAHGETGFLAREYDEETLAEYIVRILTDKSLWLRFSVAAAEHARTHFDLARQVGRLEDYYDQARGLSTNSVERRHLRCDSPLDSIANCR
jgi:colanic acid/amylovoran biosynthesis glycosyltransferase